MSLSIESGNPDIVPEKTSLELLPGDSCHLKIRLVPNLKSPLNKWIHFRSNDPQNPALVLPVKITTLNSLPHCRLSAPASHCLDDLSFNYQITDQELNKIDLYPRYSINAGLTWERASTEGDTSGLSSSQYNGSVTWNSHFDLQNGFYRNVLFTLLPFDGDYYNLGSSEIFIIDSLIPHPVMSLGNDQRFCTGELTELSPDRDFADYLWNTGATSKTITVGNSGNYSLRVRDSGGCKTSDSVWVEALMPFDGQELCLVSVSRTGKNLLVWEDQLRDDLLRYRIYKESAAAHVYVPIHEQLVSDLTVFVDNESNPSVRSDRYRIAVVDTCGNESDPGPFHKTIHLEVSAAVPSGYNLSWDHIEVENKQGAFATYYIYRGTSYASLELIDSIASSFNQYRDVLPPPGQIYYQIAARKPESCQPSSGKKSSENYQESFSNLGEAEDNSLDHLYPGLSLQIYPNPFQTETHIRIPLSSLNRNTLFLTDLTGRLVFEDSFEGSDYLLTRDRLEKGVYILHITGSGRWTAKLSVE